MLKLSYNVSNHLYTNSDTSLFTNVYSPVNWRNVPVLKRYRLRAVLSTDQGSLIIPVDSIAPANQFRHGQLMEDGCSYTEKLIVRSYDVGINKTATVERIANLLQEVGCNHYQNVGFSTDGFATTLTMRSLNLIWVASRIHIEVYKYSAWSDVIEIETWCQIEGSIKTRRDWILRDYGTGEIIGRATSKWVMMNQNTRRLHKLTDEVRDELLVLCPREPRLAFPENNNISLQKIPKFDDSTPYSVLGLKPRRADLDMNQHVNNATYIGWILESIPQEIANTHELNVITIDYKRECNQDDTIDSFTTSEIPSKTVSKIIGNKFASLTKQGHNC